MPLFESLRPSGVVSGYPTVGWTASPAGTAWEHLSDSTDPAGTSGDGTYMQCASGGGSNEILVSLGNHVLPAGYKRHQIRTKTRARAPSGGTIRVMLGGKYTAPQPNGITTGYEPASDRTFTPPTGAAGLYESPWFKPTIAGSSGWESASAYTPILVRYSTGSVLNQRVHDSWVEFDLRAKPTFEIQGFQGGTVIPEGGDFDATNRPRFQFNNCQYDGLTARSWTAKLKTPGGTLLWQTTGAGMPTSVTAPNPMTYLEPGIYVAEFQISSTVGNGVEFLSDVVTYNFSVTYESIDSQITLVEPNCELGGYIITVEVGDPPPPPPAPPRPAITSATLFGAWDAISLDGTLSDGDTVTAWAAEGGAKVFDSSTGIKPTYVAPGGIGSLNELSGVKFASGQTIRGSLGVVNHPRTFFYVMHTPPNDDTIFYYLTGAGGLGWVTLATWNTPANQWYFMTHQWTGPHVGFAEAGYHDSPHLFTFVHKTPNAFVRVDQEQMGTASPVMDAGGGVLDLGAGGNAAGPNFIMHELLIYEGEVSAADIDLIEDYLFTKWFTPLEEAVIPEMTVMRHDLITGGLEPVRGLTNLEPNQTYRIVDYEAPANHEVAYWLYEGGPSSEVPIGGGTLPTPGYLQDVCTEQMYLRWLLNPSVIASNFCLGPIGELSYQPRSGVFPVIGRADPVVVNDRQETARGTLRFIGQTTAEVNQLRKMLTKDAQPTLLTIHESYMLGKEGQLYFQPLAVREQWLNPDNRIPMHALTVDYVEIAPPAGTAPLEPPPVGIQFGNGGWIVWGTDPPTGIPHGDPLDQWQSFQHLLSSDHTFETALYGI